MPSSRRRIIWSLLIGLSALVVSVSVFAASSRLIGPAGYENCATTAPATCTPFIDVNGSCAATTARAHSGTHALTCNGGGLVSRYYVSPPFQSFTNYYSGWYWLTQDMQAGDVGGNQHGHFNRPQFADQGGASTQEWLADYGLPSDVVFTGPRVWFLVNVASATQLTRPDNNTADNMNIPLTTTFPFSDQQWHHVEWYVRNNTTEGYHNGHWTGWVDGNVVVNIRGIFSRPGWGSLVVPYPTRIYEQQITSNIGNRAGEFSTDDNETWNDCPAASTLAGGVTPSCASLPATRFTASFATTNPVVSAGTTYQNTLTITKIGPGTVGTLTIELLRGFSQVTGAGNITPSVSPSTCNPNTTGSCTVTVSVGTSGAPNTAAPWPIIAFVKDATNHYEYDPMFMLSIGGGSMPYDYQVGHTTPTADKTITRGSSSSANAFNVTNNGLGTPAAVTFSAEVQGGTPTGMTFTFSPTSCTPNPSCAGPPTVTVNTTAATPLGNYVVTVKATDTTHNLEHYTAFNANVTASATYDFSIGTPTFPSQSVVQGSSTAANGMPLTSNGTGTPIPATISAAVTSGSSTGITFTYGTNPCTPTCTPTVQVNTTGSTTVETKTITVTATDAAPHSHSTSYTVQVTSASAPNPPTGLTTSNPSGATGDTRVDVSWTAPASGPAPTSYNVYRCVYDNGVQPATACTPVLVQSISAPTTSWQNTGLVPRTRYRYQVSSVASGVESSLTTPVDAAFTSQIGLAAGYPQDVGIQGHAATRFVERFDEGSVAAIITRWGDCKPQPNCTIGLSLDGSDRPTNSPNPSLVGITGGGINQSQLYTNMAKQSLANITDTAYLRYYIKSRTGDLTHHTGIWLGGRTASTVGDNFPFPHANCRPPATLDTSGNQWNNIQTLFEMHANGTPNADFYTYWLGMQADASNPNCPTGGGDFGCSYGASAPSPLCFPGNGFMQGQQPVIPQNTWHSVEIMLKLNNPLGATNGEQAAWVDGVKQVHVGPGFPVGAWDNGAHLNIWQPGPGSGFPGFQWSNPAIGSGLNINYLWLAGEPYIGGASTQTKFSNVVLATSYIGPLAAASSAPVANFSGNPLSGQMPLTVNFTDLSTNSPTGWSWNFGDPGCGAGCNTSTLQNPSHVFTALGSYNITLQASNGSGTSAPLTKTGYITVTNATQGISGLDFQGNIGGISQQDLMRFAFHDVHLNGLLPYGQGGTDNGNTYIWRVYPRPQLSGENPYYCAFFWSNNDGQNNLNTATWNGQKPNGATNYGAHPYPRPLGQGGSPPWYWELAAQFDNYNATTGVVTFNQWYTQVFRVTGVPGGLKHHEYYWDWDRDQSKMISYDAPASWGDDLPPAPSLTWGNVPWAPGNGEEIFNGIIRGIQIYNRYLPLGDVQAEITSPLSSTLGATGIWYLNLNPTPTPGSNAGIADQKPSGTPHNPTWEDSSRPLLFTEGDTSIPLPPTNFRVVSP